VEELIKSYNIVFHKTGSQGELLPENIEISRRLFTHESLELRDPVTKDFNVIALLYGLPFNVEQLEILGSYVLDLKDILGNTLNYFVKPQNFGLELCVLKWPEEKGDKKLILNVQNCISGLAREQLSEIEIEIHGMQINPDGCVVARGVDKNGEFRKLRRIIFEMVPQLPKRQSQWVHIPIGRVLEPVDDKKFRRLIHYFEDSIQSKPLFFGNIGSLKMIEEFQWYMEKHNVLKCY
jgi:hypothetical protein